MNQNFGFMKQFEGMLLSGKKDRTNRPKTEFRLKCNFGDYMHNFTGFRTENCKKLFDSKVIKRPIWNIDDAPLTIRKAKEAQAPLINETWFQFAINDGFKHYKDFLNYFQNHEYYKKKKNRHKKKEFICFHFEKIDLDKLYKKRITDFVEHPEILVSKSLWEFNETCPECGDQIKNHDIQDSETGMSYCSNECAEIHVKENYKDGGENMMEDDYDWEKDYNEMMKREEERNKSPKQRFRENILEKLNDIASCVDDGGIIDQLQELNKNLKDLIKVINRK